MTSKPDLRNERGIALLTVLLVGFALSAMALATSMWILNAQLVQKSGDRAAVLNDAAVAALEEGRSRLAATPAVYPAAGYATLDTNAQVRDGAGIAIPGVRRYVYAGPDGITSGQYGVYGTIIATVTDTFGNKAVRRLQVNQESFAKFAYFTTIEGNIVFANNDQIRGPVHSNDLIKIDNSGATFFEQVTTAQSSIQGQANGTFSGPPPRMSVPPIALPTTQAFTSLQTRAANAGMSFASNNNGASPGEASLRLEFVSLDLNADGDSTDADEGFVRIYQDNNRPWYVTAQLSGLVGNDIRRSPNCGVPITIGGGIVNGAPPNGNTVRFRSAADTVASVGAATGLPRAGTMLSSGGAQWRCYLGGDPRLRQQTWPNPDQTAWNLVAGAWTAGNPVGWIPRPAAILAPIVPAFVLRPGSAFLWPINRTYNRSWEGVIYVNGRVAVSGVVNGRVTIASPNNIILADDVRNAVDPGSAAASNCTTILGLFAGDSVMVADNTINTPQQLIGAGPFRTYDATTEEDVHAVVLALEIFGAERYDQGPDAAQPCGGTASGRGCLNLTGGIIQNRRGAVGLTGGEGYIKRYAYNACAATDPPPYFPTTGKFSRNRIYELDPQNFSVTAWFAANQNN